jgi:hypothetical protein
MEVVNQQAEATVAQPQQQEVQPQTVQNPEMGQNIEQTVQPQSQGAIPYSRFKEVIGQKNELAAKIAQYEQILANQAVQQPAYQQPQSAPQINTVDDLLGVVQSLVDQKLNQAYETKLKPVEGYMQNSQFTSNVERYFSDPAKAQVRAEMDAYTASLDPQSQEFLKQQIRVGNTRMLDAIHYQILAEKGQSVQQQANQQAQGMANIAQQPQPFRVVRQGDPTLQDIKQNALQSGNYKNFFAAIAPK